VVGFAAGLNPMAQILKLPFQASKLGYKRVRRRCKPVDPNQLDLFTAPPAHILKFDTGLSPFEQALLFDERGDQRAGELYTAAIEKDDCVADSFCNLGIIETQLGNNLKAFDCFTSALKHNARHSEAHYNLGNLYFDQNDFRLAQLHFEMAGEFDPDFANAFFNLALVHAISCDAAATQRSLARYQQLVSADEARAAAETIENVSVSMSEGRISRFGSP
jgi:tetratricopeptide (TPR) repeat protein